MDILDFKKVFDFIEAEMPSTKLNDEQLKEVHLQFLNWKGPEPSLKNVMAWQKSKECNHHWRNSGSMIQDISLKQCIKCGILKG